MRFTRAVEEAGGPFFLGCFCVFCLLSLRGLCLSEMVSVTGSGSCAHPAKLSNRPHGLPFREMGSNEVWSSSCAVSLPGFRFIPKQNPKVVFLFSLPRFLVSYKFKRRRKKMNTQKQKKTQDNVRWSFFNYFFDFSFFLSKTLLTFSALKKRINDRELSIIGLASWEDTEG